MGTMTANPAPYCLATIEKLRESARRGVAAEKVAAELCWTPEQVRRIGRKHDAFFPEAKPEAAAKPGKTINVVQAAPTPAPKYAPPRMPAVRTRGRSLLPHPQHPRCHFTTIALSDAAFEAAGNLASEDDYALATVLAVCVDFIARKGRLPAVLKEALAEPQRGS